MFFEYNENDVCQNPIVENIFEDKKCKACIKYSEYNGSWFIGYSYTKDGGNEGGGCSPAFSDREKFKTKDEARERALTIMLSTFSIEKYPAVHNAIKSKFEQQGSLF
jgi:hypothetical protein